MNRRPTSVTSRLRPRAVVGVLGLSLVLSGCAAQTVPEGADAASNTFLEGVLSAPASSSDDPLAMDREYVTLLLRNHYDAVQASDLVLEQDALDGEARAIAERVREENEGRVGELEGRLREWGLPVPERPEPPKEAFEAEGSSSAPAQDEAEAGRRESAERRAGLLSDDDKSVLVSVEPEFLDATYLLQMHRLYQGAVTLSASEVESGSDEQMKAFAQELLDSHREDMQRMVEVLDERGAIGADGPETAPPSGYTGPIKLEGAGADGGQVDHTPSAMLRVQSQWAAREAQTRGASPSGSSSSSGSTSSSPSATPSPSPADTARPGATPSPSPTPSR